MSRAKTIKAAFKAINFAPQGEYGNTLTAELGRTYDAGLLEGSGQSSITALEREVIVSALEYFHAHNFANLDAYDAAVRALASALEKAEAE